MPDEQNKIDYLYVSYSNDSANVKIGRHSGNDPQGRMLDYNRRRGTNQTTNHPIVVPTGTAVEAERRAHSHFSEARVANNTELFEVSSAEAIRVCELIAANLKSEALSKNQINPILETGICPEGVPDILFRTCLWCEVDNIVEDYIEGLGFRISWRLLLDRILLLSATKSAFTMHCLSYDKEQEFYKRHYEESYTKQDFLDFISRMLRVTGEGETVSDADGTYRFEPQNEVQFKGTIKNLIVRREGLEFRELYAELEIPSASDGTPIGIWDVLEAYNPEAIAVVTEIASSNAQTLIDTFLAPVVHKQLVT